jgi:signal transduction histidine kinase
LKGLGVTVLARDLGDGFAMPESVRAAIAPAGPPALWGELRDVLLEMADASRLALGVDRASVLLLDAADRLAPAVSVARNDDKALWNRFLQMPPVCLDSLPGAWDMLRAGEVLAVDDVAASQVVPVNIRVAFQLRSLAIAPVFVGDEPVGALVVDHQVARHFTPAELDTLRGIAAATGSAIRRAREYADAVERSRDLDLAVRVTADLNAATTLPEVLDAALAGLVRLLGATSASINLLDGASAFRTIAASGRGQPSLGAHPLPEGRDIERVRHSWTRRPVRPIVFAGARLATLATLLDRTTGELDGAAALVPLHAGDDVRGFAVLLSTDDAALDPKRLALVRSLAEPITRAIDRAQATDAVQRRLEHVEAMHHLVDDLALSPDMSRLLERIAPTVRDVAGAEILDVYLCDERASRLLATPKPRGELARLITRLRRKPDGPVAVDGTLLVPMVVDERLVGVMRLRTLGARAAETDARCLLSAIADELARIVTGTVLRAKIAESERELALAGERERIARDLHDTLGQLHFSVGLQLDQLADSTPDEAQRDRILQVRGVVGRANEELRQAIHALSYLHRTAADLPSSLRQLVRGIEAAGIHARLKVSGPPRALTPGQQEALYRAANEALVNVKRHARATDVTVLLTYAPTRTTLVIRDNGAGLLAPRETAGRLHFGVRTMQRRLEEVGGELEIRNVPEGGVRVTAWVSTGGDA